MDAKADCKHIDSVFLEGEGTEVQQENLNGLKAFTERFDTLFPSLDLIRQSVTTSRVSFAVYDVMLESLHRELADIQDEVRSLETKLQFETQVYDRLKSICLSLTIDDEYLHALETGVFTSAEDLPKMEKSLSILDSFLSKEYTLRIIREKETEICTIQRTFLKRFVVFLSKLFVQSDSRGELKVHRSFYESMSKYKFIYKFCRTHSDFYRVLCDAYVKQSKSLYMQEFHGHLNRISELITDNQALVFSIESLVRTYGSLLECEQNFMRLMCIDSDPAEIFNSIDLMILDFLDVFFKKSSFCVLVSIRQFCTDSSRERLGSLHESLVGKYQVLEEMYISQLQESTPSFDYSIAVNLLVSTDSDASMIERITRVIYEKLSDKSIYVDAGKAIRSIQILNAIEHEGKTAVLDIAKKRSTPLVLEVALGNEEWGLPNLLSFIDTSKPGAEETAAFVKATLLENCGEDKRDSLVNAISKFDKQGLAG